MARLNMDERNQAIGMLRAGQNVSDVSRAFNCTRATINRLITRFRITGSVRDRPRVGRPRATTAADDHYITLTHLRRRFQPATVIARAYGITAHMIRNRLRANARPIRARRVYVGQILTQRHRNA
jgi:transposase